MGIPRSGTQGVAEQIETLVREAALEAGAATVEVVLSACSCMVEANLAVGHS